METLSLNVRAPSRSYQPRLSISRGLIVVGARDLRVQLPRMQISRKRETALLSLRADRGRTS